MSNPPPSVSAPSHASTCRAFSKPDDDELRALRGREPDAIEKWICGSQRMIFAYVLSYARNAEQAREVVQETIARALESLPSFRGEAKVSTWLYSIARNVVLQHRRDNDHRTPTESDRLERLNHQETPRRAEGGLASGPVAQVEKAERQERFYGALSELRPSYREIIRLRDLKEKTTTETAEALGLTEVNVRVRLHRARGRLREALNVPAAPA
jgi:RNA polymerase sigma-70 factor (ECF subfamily)